MNTINIAKLNTSAQTNLKNLILENEKNFYNQIETICQKICQNSNIKIILLAGPSASGKTPSAKLIKLNLEKLGKKVVSISLDNFFLPLEQTPKLANGSYDFECLEALDLPYLKTFINDLLTKNRGKMPIYNFLKHRPEEKKEDVVADNNTIIIFEGLHALNPALIENNNKILKLYIALTSNYKLNGKTILNAQDVRLLRRITRDHYTRGYNSTQTLKLWKNVLEGEKKYIIPFKNLADITINSSYPYEALLYANYTKKLITNENNKKLKKLEIALDNFVAINKDFIPTKSLLWEFVQAAE